MKKGLFISMIIVVALLTPGCNSQNAKQENESSAATFDIQKARSFIDSINVKFSQQIKDGDSVALASHYAPDAEILLDNSEPVKSSEIVSTWGTMVRTGPRDWSFTTTDLQGNSDFLIETGGYELRDANKNLAGRGKYVVVWKKQPNGEWKLYRDIGTSSPMPSK